MDISKPQQCSIVGDIYDNYLLKIGQRDAEKRKYDHFHPSEWGGCKRAIFLKTIGFKKDSFDPQRQRIFEAGHAHHHKMQKHFADKEIKLKLRGKWECTRCGKIYGEKEKIGIYVPEYCECREKLPEDFPGRDRKYTKLFDYREISVEDIELNFRGNVDGIIDIETDDSFETYVIDFKTINGNAFSFLKEPDYKYVVQINIYMMCLGIDKGIIMYENKDKHEIREYLVHYDQILIDNIIKKGSKKLQEMLKNPDKFIPKIPDGYELNKFPCSYCDVKEACYKIEKQKKEKANSRKLEI